MSKHIHEEKQRKKQVKVRVPKEIVDQFDDWCDQREKSRSKAIREYMRTCVSAREDYKTPLEPPTDDERLETAYHRLCTVANSDGIVREKTASAVLASALGVSQTETVPMVVKPLVKRGYIKRESNIWGASSYRIVGWS